MMESIISYIIKTLLIYYYYITYGINSNSRLILVIAEIIAIWWIYDNAINPLIFGNEDRSKFFSKIFSVNVLNICISIYYIIGGIIMYLLWSYWNRIETPLVRISTIFLFLYIYNRVYYSILNITNDELKEGFCGCGLA